MGACARKGKAEENLQGMVIDEELKKHKKKLNREIKLLLLGAGDSGKSTFAKQMKIIHLQGFSLEERKQYVLAVISNVITSMQCLIRATFDLGYKLSSNQQLAAEELLRLSGLNDLTPELREDILRLYTDKSVKLTEKKINDIYLPDSATYFFSNLDRILAPDYVPTVEDILRTRVKTMGVNELMFEINGNIFRLVDVGGQRSERRKWIHCFQDVTAIIFCVAISEYNLALEEDPTVNRMHESLQLFSEICNSGWFQDVCLILFLNKSDIFKQKIKNISLQVCFEEYEGANNYREACDYIEKKFQEVDKSGQKSIYAHVTEATNTDNIKFVFEAVKDTIIQGAIYELGQSTI